MSKPLNADMSVCLFGLKNKHSCVQKLHRPSTKSTSWCPSYIFNNLLRYSVMGAWETRKSSCVQLVSRQSAEVSASCAGDGFSGLSGSLSSLSSQGLAVGLGYTSLNPPLRSLPLCFSSLSWAAHTLTYTHLSFPWIHHPGLRSQERGWQGLEEPLILHYG